jgi:hypothetical protein
MPLPDYRNPQKGLHMRHRAPRRLVPASLASASALAAMMAGPDRAMAGHHGKHGQAVATVAAVPVQTHVLTATPVVAATPVYVTRAPLFARRSQVMLVNSVAAPTTTSFVTTSAPMVSTSYVVASPTTVTATSPTVTTATPQVSVSQSGQTFTLTITGTAAPNQNVATTLTQGLVAESVAVGEAPYLQGIFDGAGRGPIAGLLKAALRKLIQSLGPNGTNKDLLKQIATFLLQNAFGGNFAFDLSKALPEIDNLINSLLNEQKGASGANGGGTLPAGTYPIQGTFAGTITVGPTPTPTPTPTPSPTPIPTPTPTPTPVPDRSNPADRDSDPSKSPFGTGSP